MHVGIIMDGNRRWARARGLSAIKGHVEAVDKTVEALIERAGERGVEYLTMWAFSTENWERDQREVSGLMNLFRSALATKVEKFVKQGARLRMIGEMGRFSPDIRAGMERAIEVSEKNNKITVTFALNYGGRNEIVRGLNRMLRDYARVQPSQGEGWTQVTEKVFEQYLDTDGMPDPDLIIRTGGEKRLSGFLMWSAAYAELYFTDVLFPDFTPEEFDKALEEYKRRQRRFGK